MGMEVAIGVDIGGTKLQFAAVDREGRIVHRGLVPTEAQLGPRQVMEKVCGGIARMIEAARSGGAAVAGIGIGSAGQIDFRTGDVAYAGDTLPGWTGMPVKRNVEQRFALPVCVDNDVNAIAIAELIYGAGRELRHFVCLALGTGIGGAIVEDGRLVRGAFGGAGELGHVSVDFNGPRCASCGNNGCIELYASGSGIARLAREAIASRGWTPAWRPEPRDVIRAWTEGDAQAAEVMDQVVRALGAAIGGYIHAFNPEAVVIGGGVAETGPALFRALEREKNARTSPGMRPARILPASVGADAGVVGAAAQVWHYFHDTQRRGSS